MALTKTYEAVTNLGTQAFFPNAYIKIAKIIGDKTTLEAHVDFYTEQHGFFIKTEYSRFSPVLEGDNFIKQAYQFLKTLPEFSDAVDC